MFQISDSDDLVGDALQLHRLHIFRKRDRGRTKVSTLAGQILRQCHSFLCDDVGVVAGDGVAFERYQLFFSETVQNRLDHRKAETNM